MHASTRLRSGALIGVLALAGGLALPTPAFAADDPVVKDDPIRFDSGHIDAFNLIADAEGSVRLLLKEDITGSHVLRTPESVELAVGSDAYSTELPAAFVPSGAPTSFWHLPLTQDSNLIWPGWDTQSLQPAFPGAKAEIDVDVEGPGSVFLWTQGTWGTPAPLLVGGGYELPGAIDQPFPAHTHANWAFTEPGTYTLTASARVASSDGTKTATSNEATYTFVVAPTPSEVTITGAEDAVEPGTDLTLTAAQAPEGADYDVYTWQSRASDSAEWELVEGAESATLTVAAEDGVQYRAAVAGGKDYTSGTPQPISVQSAPVTITTQVPVEQPTLTITPFAGHYHSGSPIDLQATSEPVIDGADYRWYVQREDQNDAELLADVNTSSHRITAEQALDGAIVTAELIGADGQVLATAEPATIEVDDHGAAPLQKVTVGGIEDHYHSGDEATLTASVDPASVLTKFQWFVQKDGETQPQPIAGATAAEHSFTVTDEFAGAAFVTALTYDDGRTYVESAPVLVHIDDHGAVPDTELSIATDRDADDYWVGQTATLTAKQSTPTGLTTYQWLAQLPDDSEFTEVDDQTAAEYAFKPTLANSGVQVKVRLLHDGEVHAESDAITITAQQRPVLTTLTVAADKESYAPGDTAQLTSMQNPETGTDHYHWYVKKPGASDFVWVDQSRDKDLAYPVTAEDDGSQLVLRLFDETHAVTAESEPLTLHVSEDGAPSGGNGADGGDEGADAAASGGDSAGGGAGAGADAATGALATTGGEVAVGVLLTSVILLLVGSSVFVVSRRMARRNAAAE